jgi:sortase A
LHVRRFDLAIAATIERVRKMNRERLLRHYRPGWVELLFWGAGSILIAGYAGAKYWSEWERRQALEAFRDVQAAVQLQYAPEVVVGEESAPTPVVAALSLSFQTPDTSAWSAARRNAWSETQADSVVPRAVLRIDALALEVPVFAGTSEVNLTRGAGHIEGTVPPGNSGNTGIAAHRDGYFRALEHVQLGERVTLETLQGPIGYRVTRIEVVNPDAVHVLAPTATPTLTLVTCYPFYHVGPAPQRFIVRAEHVGGVARSAKLAAQAQAGTNQH